MKILIQFGVAMGAAIMLAGCGHSQAGNYPTAPTAAQMQTENRQEAAHIPPATQLAMQRQHALDSSVHPVPAAKQ